VNWPIPTSMTELRAFIDLIGYYRKFVSKYGVLAKPLTNILRFKAFQWSPQVQQDFDNIKLAMTKTLALALPNF
jgi:hypothetical protein